MPRRLALTPELAARVPPAPAWLPARPATDADHDAMVEAVLRQADGGPVWIFGYGSLIWKPGFEAAETRVARLAGWHRAFCLGWDTRFRGCPRRPGLFLALDRGGSCRGVAFRLPEETAAADLRRLIQREAPVVPTPFPVRHVALQTDAGRLRGFTFVADRESGVYLPGLAPEAVADVLARAAGPWGSMAEYLVQTVQHLEALGLRDRGLWRLQRLVAERILSSYGPSATDPLPFRPPPLPPAPDAR
jgi:glutathione-specific gamma-glutamylcyclotransferase